MSTSYRGASFLPDMNGFSGVKPFRFWCQTVLPLVYDDSLSYYELLSKVVFYINKIIEDTTTVEGEILNLRDAYINLENYVNEYFENLDVSEEIDAKLDAMVTDGTFNRLIQPITSAQVAEWLAENITPTTPAIDASLSVSGAGADAKVTGDNFKSTLMNRGTLNSASDINNLAEPGLYYINSVDGYPSGLPEQSNGRLLVIKSGSESYASNAQLFFCNKAGHESLYYRASVDQASSETAWANSQWLNLTNMNNLVGLFDDDKISIPLVRGTMTNLGAFSSANNRVRTQNSFKNIAKFQMTGYKIKFFYFSEAYDYGNSLGDKFLWSSDWMNIDTPVSPDVGYWFVPLIAKQNDSEIDAYDLYNVRKNLACYGHDSKDIILQNESVPYDSSEYYLTWNALIAEYDAYPGLTLKRTNLGNVDDGNYMYIYEMHPERNWVDASYQRIQYDGTNELYPRKKILIMGGLHGNEKCVPMALTQIAKELLNGKLADIAPKFDWYFVPLANPWGYSNSALDSNGNILYLHPEDGVTTVHNGLDMNGGIRLNKQGYDINRDFSDNTFTLDDKTYGWQTVEANLLKTFLLSQKWDVFIDCHQNHEDRTSTMKRLNNYIGTSWNGNTDPAYVAHLNKVYNTLDVVCNKINHILQNHFRRYYGRQVASTWQRQSMSDTQEGTRYSGTACDYFGGFSRDNTGNTEHTNIAADISLAIETSEVAWTYSYLADDWYNPIASTCCATAIAQLLRAVAEFDE